MFRAKPFASVGARHQLLRRFGAVEALAFAPLHSPTQTTSRRGVIVPRQLKAYGDEFFTANGDRSAHMLGHAVLMRMRNSKSILKTSVTTSFAEMGMAPAVRAALDTLMISVPAPVQQLSIPPALLRKDVLLASPSGSGKTLAFVAPLYSNMVKDRDVYGIAVREARPRAIILTSSRELIRQAHRVCQVFDATTGLRSESLVTQRRSAHKSSRLLKSTLADVLVMHPARCLKLIRSRRLFIEDLRYVVVDEADALLSKEHNNDAAKLLSLVRKRNMDQNMWPVETAVTFSTTNVTRIVRSYCERLHPNLISCVTRGGHLPPPTASLRFMKVQHEREKLDTLIYLLKTSNHQQRDPAQASGADEEEDNKWKPLPSFETEPKHSSVQDPRMQLTAGTASTEHNACPTVTFADSVMPPQPFTLPGRSAPLGDRWLREHRAALTPVDVKWEFLRTVAAPFTGPFPRTVFTKGARTIIFFRNIDSCTALYHRLAQSGFDVALVHASLPVEVRDKMMRRWAEGHCNILCATDALSRGIDFEVDLVINFDMPTNAVTFLNRVGRTARMGRKGKVVSLYTRKQRTITAVVKALVKRGISLEHVSNWYRHTTKPSHTLWRRQKINSIARKHVHLLATKTVPSHLAKTYIRHNATWRPLFRPATVSHHGGVPVRQQEKLMDRVMFDAVWYRRGVLAKRKGGQAKFGATRRSGDNNWKGIEGVRTAVGGTSGSATPSHDEGSPIGPPTGPPV